MKRAVSLISAFLIIGAAALAQQPAPAGGQGGQKIGIAMSLQNGYNNLKRNLTHAMQTVRQGNNEVTRTAALYGVIVHGNEMYGTAAVYLRSKGIVPPSTEGRGRRGRGN